MRVAVFIFAWDSYTEKNIRSKFEQSTTWLRRLFSRPIHMVNGVNQVFLPRNAGVNTHRAPTHNAKHIFILIYLYLGVYFLLCKHVRLCEKIWGGMREAVFDVNNVNNKL